MNTYASMKSSAYDIPLVDIDINHKSVMTFPISSIEYSDFDHDINEEVDAIKMKIGEYTCYVSKNRYGVWLAYVDVTDYPELHVFDLKVIDSILPFHGGCTYSQWTDHIGKMNFDKEHYLIGCDWCHNYSCWKTITAMNDKRLFGVEDVDGEAVIENLKAVIEMMPEFRLKMTIRGY